MVLRNSISLSCCVIIANRVSSYFVGAFDIVFGLPFPSWLAPVTSHAPVCNFTPTQCSRHASPHLPTLDKRESSGQRIGHSGGSTRVRPVPSLPHSFVLAGFLMERGEGGWGGTTSQGRIERCCLVRRIGDGACAGLQMLAQRVQHMRGSNNARLLPACSYSFCVLTGYVRAQEGSHCPQAPREGPGQRRCVRFSVSPNAKRRWATMQVVPCLIWLVALPSRPSHRDACLGEANA